MTFTDLQNMVVYWLDDPNFGYFTTTQVQLWLNNGQKEVQKLLLNAGEHWYTKPVQTSTIANQAEYVLPSDLLKIHRLEVVLSGTAPNENVIPIEPITLMQKDLVDNSTGVPTAYTLKKSRIVLYPYPDSIYTLRMWYSPLVANMTNGTDVPDAPEQYHEMIAILAAIDGALKDERNTTLLVGKREYYEAMMKNDAQDRRQDRPRMVVTTSGDDWNGIY